MCFKTIVTLKPWPNGVASWKLRSTCDSVWPGLGCTCVDLRRIASTCAHFGWDQICTLVKASFSPFGHPNQVASWMTSTNLLLANEIEGSLPVLARKLASPFGHPTKVSQYATSTCIHLRLLAGPYVQGFREHSRNYKADSSTYDNLQKSRFNSHANVLCIHSFPYSDILVSGRRHLEGLRSKLFYLIKPP